MGNSQKTRVGIDELRPGHFVDIGLSWMEHPFLFSRFKISSQREIDILRDLGVAEVTVIPERSSPETIADDEAPPGTEAPPPPPETDEAGITKDALWQQKQELIARDAAFRAERKDIVESYQDTVKKVSNFARDLRSGPANAVMAAEEIVGDMVRTLEKASEVLVNLVNLSESNFSMHNHALNVTVLSILLARALRLDGEEVRAIGMGALLHDVGKIDISPQIVNKITKLTPGEEGLLRTHPTKGLKLAQRVYEVPPEIAAIIEQHHELLDGSGYPRGLRGNQIWLSVRIVAIANIYDNLCNPADPAVAVSPRDSMAILYRDYQGKLDERLVGAFIKAMGVYPPGTIVRLTDDNIGMVASVDPQQLLRPRVVIYNPEIPRWNAMMMDLRERADLDIREVLKPGDCPPALYEYLGISERVGYFYESR